MEKLQSLQKIREKIRAEIALSNVVKQSNGNEQPLHNALAIIPENQILSLMQWLHETILPKVLQHRGEDSLEYKNYTAVRDAMIWAMYIIDCYERQLLQVSNDRFLLQAYKDKMLFFENELLTYKTTEQIISAETAADLRTIVVQRALSIIETKKTEQ